mgnify:CR=1 FL=1
MKKLTESDEFKDGLEIEGFVVKHPTFGIGTIVDSVYDGDSTRIHIKFEKGKARWLVASAANLTIMSNGTSDEDESDNQKAFDELYGETLEEERDSLLAQNEYLKDRLDSEYEIRTTDYISKDELERNRKEWLFMAGFMVFVAIVYLSVDEWICINGSPFYHCMAV